MDFAEWEKKRLRTVYVYFLFTATFGIDYSLNGIILIPYLQELVPDGKVNYYYSLSSIMYFVCSTLTALCLGRIVDRTRNVKYSLYFVLACFAIGQILFTLRFSPYIIVIARALCGTLPSQDYVLRGELIRCFDEEGVSKMLWWYTLASTTGSIVGSWINLAFKGINFQVGEWKINHNNFSGLMMVPICTIIFTFVFFFAHDCSKEYDLKSFSDKEKIESCRETVNEVYSNPLVDDVITSADDSSKTTIEVEAASQIIASVIEPSSNQVNNPEVNEHNRSTVKVFYDLVRSLDIMLMMFTTLLSVCAQNSSDLMNVLIILEIFKWPSKYLNIFQCASSVGTISILIVMSKFVVSSKQIYKAFMFTIMSSFVAMVLLIVIVQCAFSNIVQITIFIVYIFAELPVFLLDAVIIPNILGRMVSTDYQSFAESCRSIMSLISCIVVGIFIASDSYLKYLLYLLVGFILIILFTFCYRRKRMINVKLHQF